MDFGQNFRKFSILVKIFENLDFGQISWNSRFIFKKSRFWPKFSNSRILSKIVVNYKLSRFLPKVSEILILVKIYKFLILVKVFKNVDLGKIFGKYWFLLIFLRILALVEISKNLDFSQDFRKSRFLPKISEIMSIFVKIFYDPEFSRNFRSSWFCSKF